MDRKKSLLSVLAFLSLSAMNVQAAPPPNSYMSVVVPEDFQTVVKKMEGAKAAILKKHQDLLNQRYDLNDKHQRQ
jgi:hypothetical protein